MVSTPLQWFLLSIFTIDMMVSVIAKSPNFVVVLTDDQVCHIYTYTNKQSSLLCASHSILIPAPLLFTFHSFLLKDAALGSFKHMPKVEELLIQQVSTLFPPASLPFFRSLLHRKLSVMS
jgi:predicted nuclease with RNAse H fold